MRIRNLWQRFVSKTYAKKFEMLYNLHCIIRIIGMLYSQFFSNMYNMIISLFSIGETQLVK